MSEKTFPSRFVCKHDTEENWLKATNFSPKRGEIIVYDIDVNYDYERIKIGDGETNVNNLPFVIDEKLENKTTSKQVQIIEGDGATTVFYVQNVLESSELSVTVQDFDTNEIVFTSVVVNLDQVIIGFSSEYVPPIGKKYKVIMIAGAAFVEPPTSVEYIAPIDHSSLLNRNHVDAHHVSAISGLFDAIYPIGSIYMSVVNTDPSTLFGGVWEALTDRFLLGAGNMYAANSTGGEATHTLTVDEMPAHNHKLKTKTQSAASGTALSRIASDGTGVDTVIETTGGGQPHNNMPPYIAVYMWKRIA